MELRGKACTEFRKHVILRANYLIDTRPDLAQSLLFFGGQLERVGTASDNCIAKLGESPNPTVASEAKMLLREIRDLIEQLSI